MSEGYEAVVDHDACGLNAICMGIAPEVFEIGADDRLRVLVARLAPDQEADAFDAAASCPNGAIAIVRATA